jgi:hypothetical protein
MNQAVNVAAGSKQDCTYMAKIDSVQLATNDPAVSQKG